MMVKMPTIQIVEQIQFVSIARAFRVLKCYHMWCMPYHYTLHCCMLNKQTCVKWMKVKCFTRFTKFLHDFIYFLCLKGAVWVNESISLCRHLCNISHVSLVWDSSHSFLVFDLHHPRQGDWIQSKWSGAEIKEACANVYCLHYWI